MPESQHERRSPRYVAHCEVHVAFSSRNVVTLTREISRSGLFFFADPPPAVGERVRATLHPDATAPFGVDCVTRYVLPGVGAGVALASDALASEAARFAHFVDEQATISSAWRAIGGFVRSAEEGDASADVEIEPKELIEVGETGEAFRVFFERYPAIPVERSELASHPILREQAELALAGVSSEAVHMKLHAHDRVRRAHLGILAVGSGFVAVVPGPDERQGASFYSLSGRELLLVKQGDRAVFPFFTSSDLLRIQRGAARPVDSGRRTALSDLDHQGAVSTRWVRARRDEGARPEAQDGLRTTTSAASPLASLSDWTRFDGMTSKILVDLFDVLHAETRVYLVGGVERPVRLLRNLTVTVRDATGLVEDATLMHDGERVCALFGLKTRTEMRIRPLSAEDQVRLPAW